MTVPYSYVRKVMAIGNSLMVSLPKLWTKANAVKIKSKVNVEVYPDKLVITVHKDGKTES